MPDDSYRRMKEISKWQAGAVYNYDHLLKPVNDTDKNIHLDNRQVSQRRRWQRVHRVQDKIDKKRLTKEMPMAETRAREWLKKLDKKEKGDSLDEKWGKAALGAGALATYYSGMTVPLIKTAGKVAYNVVPGVKPAFKAGKYVSGVPGKVGKAIGKGASAIGGAAGSAASAAKSAAASTVPKISAPTEYGQGVHHAVIATKALGVGVIGYSIGALIGALSRAAAHLKYRVNKEKLKQVAHIPNTTEKEDVSGALDWFGFHHQAGMIRSGKGDPVIALENILRALNGDKDYVNPMTGGKMLIKEKVPMFNMGKKAIAISDLYTQLKNAHEYIKDFKFTYMIQERFKWETPEDYYTAHKNLDEALLTIALLGMTATLGAIQFGKFQSLLNNVGNKVDRLMSSTTEDETLKLIGQIVDAFDFNIGKLIVSKKADPLLALQLVLDYLEGNQRTRNPSNGYKMATPIKPTAPIPFGGAGASTELLGYIEEVQDLIKKLNAQR